MAKGKTKIKTEKGIGCVIVTIVEVDDEGNEGREIYSSKMPPDFAFNLGVRLVKTANSTGSFKDVTEAGKRKRAEAYLSAIQANKSSKDKLLDMFMGKGKGGFDGMFGGGLGNN